MASPSRTRASTSANDSLGLAAKQDLAFSSHESTLNKKYEIGEIAIAINRYFMSTSDNEKKSFLKERSLEFEFLVLKL
jgi:hypothetical protein